MQTKRLIVTREYGINFESAFDTTVDQRSDFLGVANSASRRMEATQSPVANIPLRDNNLSSRTMIQPVTMQPTGII